jgi:DNA-directed RNA polymerase subunit H (RpoH/RPB5)
MEKAKQLNTLLAQVKLDIKTTDRYFKIHRTVVEMLEARGYIIGQAELDSTEDLFSFLGFLVDKKQIDDAEFLKEMVLGFLENKVLEESESKYKKFVSDEIPVLIDDMSSLDIENSIKKIFKVIVKLEKLKELINEAIENRRELKSIESLNHLYKKPDGSLIQTYYFYNAESDKKKIGQVIMDISAYQRKEKDLKEILFIADQQMNTQMTEDLKRYKENIKFSIFIGDHLLFNITKHFLVPKHHLMNEEEYKAFVATEKNLLRKLPLMFETDPIARFYGAKPGQIFKIIRENLSDDSMVRYSEFYRLVTTALK